MASISDIISVSITNNSRTATRVGFGTMLIMAYHTVFPELSRLYTDLDGMTGDGFATTSAAYKMAAAAFAQEPRPEKVRVGRLPAAHTLTRTLTITSAVQGQHIKAKLLGPDGTINVLDYTIGASATTTSVATAVEALIEAYTGINSAPAAAVITITPATAGDTFYLYDLENCTQEETTADANYDDALTALLAVVDDWYYITMDTNSHTNVDLVAAWTQTRDKQFMYQTSNYTEKSGTGVLASGLKASAYTRTSGLFVDNESEYGQCALIGKLAPKDPGSVNAKFRTLTGVTPGVYTSTEEAFFRTNNLNFYSTIAGISAVLDGTAASGQFIDIGIGTDALKARIQERVFTFLANADKRDYTDATVDAIRGEIFAVMETFVASKFLSAGTLSVTAPKVSAIDVADRALRLLPDVKFAATLAGAVNKVQIVGTLSV